MRRVSIAERPNWRQLADEYGFSYAMPDGQTYWDESVCYQFTLGEIEDDLEAATSEMVALCGELAGRAVRDEAYLKRLAIPESFWSFIETSWNRSDMSLYGRFDFVYGGNGPAKLLEFNADTPTAAYEAAVFQWLWLEDRIAAGKLPGDADQFNSLHDKLIARFKAFPRFGTPFHMTAFSSELEDRKTVEYLADCAREAGHQVKLIDIADIGRDGLNQFVDDENRSIQRIFKLYPWEWLIHEPFGAAIPLARTTWIEPPWKMLLSTKAILPELWKIAPGHPNLLEAYHEGDPAASALARDHVAKPIFSREGANVEIKRGGMTVAFPEGPYDQVPRVLQALAPDVVFDGMRPVIGSWIVDTEPAGIGIREDKGLVTGNLSRFVPHAIVG
jgi:glutathionylspermidine synthase